MYDEISTPGIVIELQQVEKNLKELVMNNEKYGIHVRPHIKPHKSVFLAKLQLELGCVGITCAKISEAEVMATHGIKDILIAFPLIGKDKMDRLGKLLDNAYITTIVNSEEGARQLSNLGKKKGTCIRTLIELDGGTNRGGVKPYEPAVEFAKRLKDFQGIEIVGIMYYGGQIYTQKTLEGFHSIARKEHDEIIVTAGMLKKVGCNMEILSGGNSYSARCSKELEGITEVRAGNSIFNDCLTLTTGFATVEQCALRVVSTIVSIVDENHAIIDAGSKTLTTDLCANRPGYGYVIDRPDITITNLNEEHGFIETSIKLGLNIGDKITIIPNHACVLPNLADIMYGMKNGILEHKIPVEARGMNY